MREKFNLFNRKRIDTIDVESFEPLFFRLNDPDSQVRLEKLLDNNRDIVVHDTIHLQLLDLLRCRHPHLKPTSKEMTSLLHSTVNMEEIDSYGVWVYFPWSRKVIHLLDENEFVEVRTNRNKNKITQEEQDMLSQKTIGIIGLSVGQAVAITLATERLCGALKIADFDTLDLSNLNRLKASVADIDLPKTIITARQIKEIDPYLKVEIYGEGINENNIDKFLLEGRKLNLLIEECDSFHVKVLARLKARKSGIPVLMDTSDRGMIDIERFDLEPNRKLFHGLLTQEDYEVIRNALPQDIGRMMLEIVEVNQLSERLRMSFPEIGKTLVTWPQLASAVVSGGGLTADISRKILLNQTRTSGRFYISAEDIV